MTKSDMRAQRLDPELCGLRLWFWRQKAIEMIRSGVYCGFAASVALLKQVATAEAQRRDTDAAYAYVPLACVVLGLPLSFVPPPPVPPDSPDERWRCFSRARRAAVAQLEADFGESASLAPQSSMTAYARRQRVLLATFQCAEGLPSSASLGSFGSGARAPPEGYAAAQDVAAMLVPPGTMKTPDGDSAAVLEAKATSQVLHGLLRDGVLELVDPGLLKGEREESQDAPDDESVAGGEGEKGEKGGGRGRGGTGFHEAPDPQAEEVLQDGPWQAETGSDVAGPMGEAQDSEQRGRSDESFERQEEEEEEAEEEEEEAEEEEQGHPRSFVDKWIVINPMLFEAMRLVLQDEYTLQAAELLDELGRGYLQATELLLDRVELHDVYEKARVVREQLRKERDTPGGQLHTDHGGAKDKAWTQAKISLQELERKLFFQATELRRRRESCKERRADARRQLSRLSRRLEERSMLDDHSFSFADEEQKTSEQQSMLPGPIKRLMELWRPEEPPSDYQSELAWARKDFSLRGGEWSFGYFYGTDEEREVARVLTAPTHSPDSSTSDEAARVSEFVEDVILAEALAGRLGVPLP
eukprot:scaffold48_cov311-Pinguiococcus_pyrenoidosus.AAC.171